MSAAIAIAAMVVVAVVLSQLAKARGRIDELERERAELLERIERQRRVIQDVRGCGQRLPPLLTFDADVAGEITPLPSPVLPQGGR